MNDYRNIDLHELALSDSDGDATLFIGRKSGWHSLAEERKAGSLGEIEVATRRLDSLVAAGVVPSRIDVVKIDVEGAEMAVLQGAEKTLASNRTITLLIDIHPHGWSRSG